MDRKITKDMIIGAVIEQYPSTGEVFKRRFGNGCLACPGSNNEDIAFGAAMHNVDADAVVDELNTVIKEG